MRLYHTFALPSVLQIKGLDPLAGFVLGRLIWYSIKSRGDCFYQLARCCQHLQISINRARRIFRQLESNNLIAANHSPQKITYRVNWKHPAIMADLDTPDCDIDNFDPDTDLNQIHEGSKSDPSDVQGSKTDGSKSDPLTDPNRIPDGSKSDPLRDPNRILLHTYIHTYNNIDTTQELHNTEKPQNPKPENPTKAEKPIAYPASAQEVEKLMSEWVTEHVQQASGTWAAFLDVPLEAQGFYEYWAVEHGWKRGKTPVKSIKGTIAQWLGRRKTDCERSARFQSMKGPQGTNGGGWSRNSTEYKAQIADMFMHDREREKQDQNLITTTRG